SSAGVGAQAVPGAPAGPPVRGHLDHRPPAAPGTVPRRIQLSCRPAGLVPTVRGELAPAVIAVPGLAGWMPGVPHRRTAYARAVPAEARIPPLAWTFVCDGWRNQNKRGCHKEWDNPAVSDQGRSLLIEWTAQL